MTAQSFISQIATENILLKVTNLCALCYSDISIGDTIYYDTARYHYVCQSCQDEQYKKISNQCEVIEDEACGLFLHD